MKVVYSKAGYGMFSFGYYLNDNDVANLDELYNDILEYRKNKSLKSYYADKYYDRKWYVNDLIQKVVRCFKKDNDNLIDIPENKEEYKEVAYRFKDLSLYETYLEMTEENKNKPQRVVFI